MRSHNFIDRTGHVYGRLTVTNFHSYDGKRTYWSCDCTCGRQIEVLGDNLKKGNTQSCGCLSAELVVKRMTKHNLYSHQLYGKYKAMLSRCYNSKDQGYHNYGGRGITVCERWQEPDHQGFLNFIADLQGSYKEGLQLDRIDVDGNYEPDNCRWVTNQQNSFNTRSRAGTSKYKGVCWSVKRGKWIAQICHNSKNYNLGGYESEEDAAEAYNIAATKFFKNYAKLNILVDKIEHSRTEHV